MSVGAVNKNTGERIPTAGMPAIDSILSGSSTNPVQNRVVKAALDEKANTDIVASDFSAATSYTAGEYCIYGGKFYKFKANHSGAWSASDVDEIKIAGELSSLMSGLTNLSSIISLHDIGNDYGISDLVAEQNVTFYTNWEDNTNFPDVFGSGVMLPTRDKGLKVIIYILAGDSSCSTYLNTSINGVLGTWKKLQFTT